jgi:hypothetical protein
MSAATSSLGCRSSRSTLTRSGAKLSVDEKCVPSDEVRDFETEVYLPRYKPGQLVHVEPKLLQRWYIGRYR